MFVICAEISHNHCFCFTEQEIVVEILKQYKCQAVFHPNIAWDYIVNKLFCNFLSWDALQLDNVTLFI